VATARTLGWSPKPVVNGCDATPPTRTPGLPIRFLEKHHIEKSKKNKVLNK